MIPAGSAEGADLPLRGLRVVDFGQFIAGPLCAALLADFGADVIRVEKPDGNADRFVQPLGAAWPGGGVYWQVNRNKRSLALDPFDRDSRPVLDRLLATADVVVVNAPPATLAAMGLGYERISAINPRIVLSICTAYGRHNRLSDLPGFDGIGQAMSGAAYLSGADGEPRKSYCHWVDHMTAALSAFGIMAALRDRDRTGKGQIVDASLLHTSVFAMAANLIEEDSLGVGRVGTANRAQLAGPADVYRTSDGHVLLQVIGRSMFRRCAELFDRPDWIDDPDFATDELRGNNAARLNAVVEAFCLARSTAQCLSAFRAAGLPCAPVNSPAAALNDPDLQAMGLWARFPIDTAGDQGMLVQPPVRLSRSPGSVRAVAPQLGAHSSEILEELGLEPQSQTAFIKPVP